jgi:hypothetical protein
VPVASLDKIGALATLKFARPALAGKRAVVSQGDVTLNGPAARANAGVDGTGVPVGILSDSFACNPPPFQPGAPNSSFDEDLGTELPADVNILSDGCPGGIDEGRGIGQIVHDVAPGSPLLFHTAFNSELDFAEGIQRLAAAGAKVIVDDIIYFAEPMFEDGIIAQAADDVYADGVAYFSSAGNQARQSYEDDFRGVNILNNAGANLNGGKSTVIRFHDFDPGPGVSILQPVFIASDGQAALTIVSFQWDQPYLSGTTYALRIKAGDDPALAVGATSDLDLVFFDYKGHVAVVPAGCLEASPARSRATGTSVVMRLTSASCTRAGSPPRNSSTWGSSSQAARIEEGTSTTSTRAASAYSHSTRRAARRTATRMRSAQARSVQRRGTRPCRSARAVSCRRTTRRRRRST